MLPPNLKKRSYVDLDDEVEVKKVPIATPLTKMNKRAHNDSGIKMPSTSSFGGVHVKDDSCANSQVFKFRVLLPNGTTVELKLTELRREISIEEFISMVRKEHSLSINQKKSLVPKRKINWEYQDLCFTDAYSNKLRLKVDLRVFKPNTWHLLWLHDGAAEPDEYEDMWDLTPDTDLLRELPDDYTCETALADLIDNSLQALWSNASNSRRLISVEMHPDKISIFDSGPGMDGANGNIVKWGRMGASLHRAVREKAIGGEPPYLVPFFGMFGYGGPVATMCLGRLAIVSSKTKRSKKVFTLHMEREALVNASSTENCWKTKGGVRDPLEDEILASPHGSFTKVEIFDPKLTVMALDIANLQFKLKDIYFPYIQYDEMSGKTSRPIEFQVNGKDLTEIEGGEVATTNLHSCNGRDFIVQLHFSIRPDSSSLAGQNQRVSIEANARLKCVYFPMVEGEENIQRILDKLDKDGCGIRESFESFSRVSIRRLGRLLPDTRWALLPFMEPKQKKGEKTHIMKRLCSRVKCFIDTDSGFNPTPHKTDLAHQHPYTKALKNFGNRSPENEKEVQVEITRDGKKLSLLQLQNLYVEWISEMHDRYDEETGDGLDPPTIIVTPSKIKIKKLDLASEVLRVHKEIQRKGQCWKAGQNLKVLKGACAGCHKTNVYVTLDCIILEGLSGDASGEARLICRPIGVPENRGCRVWVDDEGNTKIDINESLVFPIRIIDSEKCILVDDMEWAKKVDSINQKLPAAIEILSRTDCQELEIDGGLPVSLEAGDAPPENIVAVIRPKCFINGNSCKRLEQKFIVKDDLEMTLDIKRGDGGEHIYSVRISASSRNGIYGLYVFHLKSKWPELIQKPGNFRFSFSLTGSKDIKLEHGVKVRASAELGRWKVVNHHTNELYTARVGSCFKPIYIACYDRYKKRIPFTSVPKLAIKLMSSGRTLAQVRNKKVNIAPDKLTLNIKEFFINSRALDDIRPDYKATLHISTLDDAFSVAFPCRVIPGVPRRIRVHPTEVQKQLLPGQIIEKLSLEVFDEYGNHVDKDESISLRLNGFSCQDGSGIIRPDCIECIKKVDANGRIDLSNVLKVSKGYDENVGLSVISKGEAIFKLQFRTEKGELQAVQEFNQVHLENTPEENHDRAISDDDVGSPVQSTRTSSELDHSLLESPSLKVSQDKNVSLSPHSTDESTLKTPKLELTNAQDGCSASASASISLEELGDDFINIAMKERDHERKLEYLNRSLLHTQHEISHLQDLINPHLSETLSLCGRQATVQQIKGRSQSAAAVICNTRDEELRCHDIVGVVALLGTVESMELSRMLSQFLGEDQMLAIVCRSYAASRSLEANVLNKFATELGVSVNGGYLAFCLEDIRPSTMEPSFSLLEPLHFPSPTLPDGSTPRGFMGYAANLMTIAPSHLWCRTKSGHALRETLFYRLFGKLQVYREKDCMMAAQSCITDGAVSLDGGIIRGNGLVSLGHWEPKILFPVMNHAISEQLSIVERLEEKKLDLVKIKQGRDVEDEARRRAREEWVICRDKYNSCRSQKTQIVP